MNKGMLFVISGPSGAGKDTVLKEVLSRLGDDAFRSISMTTRKMRPGEVDKKSYYFVSQDEFLDCVSQGKMLEYTSYAGNYYGTPLAPIEEAIENGKIGFLIIEVEGGSNVRQKVPGVKEIFLLAPTFGEIEKRLRCRGTEEEEVITQRLKVAKNELSHANEYDYVVINDDVCHAADDIMSIIRAEQLSFCSMEDKIKEVLNNEEL